MPKTIAILGNASVAADLALRRAFKRKTSTESVAVLDWTGRGAALLSRSNMADLLRKPVAWYDLADRLRPAAIFQLRQSKHFVQALAQALRLLNEISGAEIAEQTLTWIANAGCHLAKDGTVGLGALMRSLSSPDVRRWFADSQTDVGELTRGIEMLAWALRYPAVYALSEGNNHCDLANRFGRKGTLWIESFAEHFESLEHHIVNGLAEIALEDAAFQFAESQTHSDSEVPTVLHMFPAASMSDRIRRTSTIIRNVGVHYLYPDRSLRAGALAWAREADELWVVGPIRRIDPLAHRQWLSEQHAKKIEKLAPGEVWIYDRSSGQSVVARTGEREVQLGLAHQLRTASSRQRKATPARQMATVFAKIAQQNSRTADLYSKLCDPDMLRCGWFRVQSARKDSCGVDGVTIERFGDNIERELSALSQELQTRRYRCRPLHRVYIPKADGTSRPLGVCCVRDRVVQAACLDLLEPIFDPTFSHFSFAFRPRRSARHALSLARSIITTGHEWVVTADIKHCFDTIDHDVLISLISKRAFDHELHSLIRHWLTVDVFDFSEFFPTELGVPQGETLSPLFCNIYLDPLDKHFERVGLKFVRYADDILVFAESEDGAKSALTTLDAFLRDPLRLQLKPAKTSYSHASSGIDFLGFKVSKDHVEVQPGKLERAIQAIRVSTKILGAPDSSFLQRSRALDAINSGVRGFRNYFALPREEYIARQMRLLDGRVEQIANELLPLKMRSDPAWIGRERFCLPQNEEIRGTEITSVGAAALQHDVYPQEEPSPSPPAIVLTREESEAGSNSRQCLLIEDRGRNGDDRKPTADAVVEYSGRLYVLAHGSYLTVDGDYLIIKKRKAEIHRRRLEELGLVFLQGLGMNVSVTLQLRLAEMDIPVVFAPPVGEPIAVLNPIISNRSYLRGQQVLRRDDPDVVQAALRMLAAKICNQAAVLRYFGKYRRKIKPEMASQLTSTANNIRNLADQLAALDVASADVRAVAMGYEGHAAALYWRELVRLVPDEASFTGRNTRKATDPINQSINYVYGMLYGEVWRAVVKNGLDPYFGLMHGSQRDQGSLVFDLIEEFRAPFGDRLVFAMIGRGFRPELNVEGFLKTRSRSLLATAFSKSWLKKIVWRGKQVSPAGILERQAAGIVNLISRTGDYRAYRMKW